MANIIDKSKAILRHISLWAWLASILPLTTLAGLWVSWVLESYSLVNFIMIAGGAVMFMVSVIWWWWALIVMKHLMSNWEKTEINIKDISGDVKQIGLMVKDVVNLEKDK